MYCEENYKTCTEGGEGSCSSVMVKLHRKKHTILITLLLILAIVSALSGLYNGLSFKKYSDLAIVVGIFFPSIILVFVCVYMAFICTRQSLHRSVLPRHLSNGNDSHHGQVAAQYTQTNSATRKNLRVKYQPKVTNESINGSAATRNEKTYCNKIFYTPDDSNGCCDAKISRRHFRSLSNSDISNQMRGNHDIFSKRQEPSQVNCRTTSNGNQYSPRLGRNQVVNQRMKFKRSVSDITNKNRNKKSRKDKSVWNTDSLENLRRHVAKDSVKNTERQSDFSCETKKKSSEISYLLKNYKTMHDHEQSFHFSNLPSGRNENIEIEDETIGTFLISDNPEIMRNRERVKSSISVPETYGLKRKTIPFTYSNESIGSSRRYAHEFCRYSKKDNKMMQRPLARNEEGFEDHQSDKQVRYQW